VGRGTDAVTARLVSSRCEILCDVPMARLCIAIENPEDQALQ